MNEPSQRRDSGKSQRILSGRVMMIGAPGDYSPDETLATDREAGLSGRSSNVATGSSAVRIARSIGMDILQGRMQPGERLPIEADLLAWFGISRTVLREAFKILTAKGLLIARTKVGTVVRDRRHWNFFDADVLAWRIDLGLDEDLMRSLREARLAVEPYSAMLAAERATDADISEMRASIQSMRDAIGDRDRFAQADLRFHRAVAAASSNFLLNSFSTVIETALVCATLLLPLENEELREEAVERHQGLLDALIKRNGAKAAELMTDMIGFGAKVGESPSGSGGG